MAFIEKEHMEGLKYVYKIRDHLDYLEEHLENVRKAFNELSKKCIGLWWVEDDVLWHNIRQQVCFHDLSKFSKEEFIEYQQAFFPVGKKSQIGQAWEHHKENNHHHWETLKDNLDVVHMIIDWTAMGYKFGDTAQEYYENNIDRIEVTADQKKIMYEIFDKIADWS
jgi:hypothetical protein